MSTFFCSEIARAAQEQLFGTAKQVGAFIALEYTSAFKRKAIESELLPDEVRRFVASIRERIPEIRFLLLRQPESKQRKPSCFVALPRETDPVVYRFELHDYRELGAIDTGALLTGAAGFRLHREPMFLICAHAQHDKCCARHGNAAIEAARAEAGARLWESSHLGGCRFAANMLCLPQGVLYGYLAPDDAVRAMRHHSEGKILLEKLRGRACFPKAVQAAEYFLRRERKLDGIDQLRFIESLQTAPAAWLTTFEVRDSNDRFSVEHTVSRSESPRLLSCGDIEPEFVWTSHLSAIS